jgi:hypothetical protein
MDNRLLKEESFITWPANPWLSIWMKPRETIRAIVDTDPERYIILIAMLSGIAPALNRASSNNAGDDSSLGVMILLALVVGAISGVILLYIGGALLNWVGNALGGEAEAVETSAAIAWASIPIIFGMVMWVPEFALYGQDLFRSYAPRISNNPVPLLLMGTIEMITWLWAIGLLVACLSEVQRFSVWEAIVTLLISGAVLFAIVFACVLTTGI